jgi:hypothetical protein
VRYNTGHTVEVRGTVGGEVCVGKGSRVSGFTRGREGSGVDSIV